MGQYIILGRSSLRNSKHKLVKMRNPFIPVLSPYFEWLTDLFGNMANEATKHKISAGVIARDYLSDPTRRQHFSEAMPSLCSSVEKFWRKNSKDIDVEICKLPGIKARFGGDIGPLKSEAVFQRAGLYFDSIIVADPLLRVGTINEVLQKDKDYYFLKYAIENVLHNPSCHLSLPGPPFPRRKGREKTRRGAAVAALLPLQPLFLNFSPFPAGRGPGGWVKIHKVATCVT